MFDDEWDDEDDEQPDHDVIVRAGLRFQRWRRRQRSRAVELRAVVRDDDMDIDWYGFGSTLGAFTGGLYAGFLEPMPLEYDIELMDGPGALVASGGLCAPVGHHVEVRWDPWARYQPPLLRLDVLIPPITVHRGGIRMFPPPAVPVPCDP